MQRLKQLFGGEDRAVSPVIGVILMVAITVILAAVIASFVLGLGDSAAEPSPSPTIDSDFSSDELAFSVTGGDDFSASDVEVQYDITVENSTTGTSNQTSGTTSITDDDVLVDYSGGPFSGDIDNATFVGVGSDVEEVTAGDEFNIELRGLADGDSEEITEWEIQLIWNPADQDSDTIYSDSNS